MSPARRVVHGALALACVALAGACSGSGDSADTTTATTVAAPPAAAVECATDAAPAGLGEGLLCADSGFRVARDDFSFANWGGVALPTEQLTVATFVGLYGAAQVCASGTTATDCVLSPVAQQTLDQQNQALGGGRCEGLAALSMRYFVGLDDRAQVASGVATTNELQRPQETLDGSIAYWWATQFAPEVQAAAAASRQQTPTALVAELANGLSTGAGYTIGIYGDGYGHAVTPFAVTKRDASYIVHIYDNNYPGEPREIVVDPAADTWSYDGAAVNPDGSASTWSGSVGTFELTPMSARTAPFSSPFGTTADTVNGSVIVRLATDQGPGDPAAGLLVTTSSGAQFGIVAGQLVNDIEGGEYTVGKGGMGTSLVELSIPELDEPYSVQAVAATDAPSATPVNATLSLTSADGTSTFVRAAVPLAVATPDSTPEELGTGFAVEPDAGFTVVAQGPTEVTVATNEEQFDASLEAGQELVTTPDSGSASIEVLSASGEVIETASVERTDSPVLADSDTPAADTTTTTSAATTTSPSDAAPTTVAPTAPAPTTVPSTTVAPPPATTSTTTTSVPTTTTSSTTTTTPPTTTTSTSTTTTTTTVPPTTTTSTSTTTTTTTVPPTTTTSTSTTTTTTLPPAPQVPVYGLFSTPTLFFNGTSTEVALTPPTSTSPAPFTWSSADPWMASVDPDTGLLTTHWSGTTVITVSQAATEGYAASSMSTYLVIQRPNALESIVMWLDPGVGVSSTRTDLGQEVTRIADRAYFHEVLGTLGSAPKIGITTKNGNPTLTFDGDDQLLVQEIGLPQPFTVAMVVRVRPGDGGEQVIFGKPGVTPTLSVAAGRWQVSGSSTFVSNEIVDDTWHLVTAAFEDGVATFRIDGHLIGVAQVGVVHLSDTLMPIGGVAGKGFVGDLGDIVVYPRAIDTGRRLLIEDFLATKYDLPSPSSWAPSTPFDGISIDGELAQGDTATITVPYGYRIARVAFASYGRATGTEGTYAVNPQCHAAASEAVMAATFVGADDTSGAVSITADDATFGVACEATDITLRFRLIAERYLPTAMVEWTPADLPGIELWFDGADASTQTIESGILTSWADKSGYGRDAYAVGSPAAAADGGFLSLERVGGMAGSLAADTFPDGIFAISIVTRVGIGSEYSTLPFTRRIYGDGGTVDGIRAGRWTGYNSRVGRWGTQSGIDTNQLLDGTRHAIATRVTPTSFQEYVDGYFSWGGTFDRSVYYDDATTFDLGCSSDLNVAFAGYIHEVIVTSVPLTDQDRERLEGYLYRKWGYDFAPGAIYRDAIAYRPLRPGVPD